MGSMKPLLPTLKEKKRYVVYELISDEPLKGGDADVLAHLRATLGLFDGAKAGLLPVRYDAEIQTGVLRCSTASVDKVKAALLLLKTVKGIPVIPHVRGVSGILNKTTRFVPEKRTII
jgi:ribonuclease P/MRP protein subunit POP5